MSVSVPPVDPAGQPAAPAIAPPFTERRTSNAASSAISCVLFIYIFCVGILITTNTHIFSFSILGHLIHIDKIHDVFFRFSIVGLAIVPIIFLMEMILVGWRYSSLRDFLCSSAPTSRSDAFWFAANHLRLNHWPQIIFAFGVTLISGAAIHDWIGLRLGIELSFESVPAVYRVALLYLVYTFLDYWAHRIDHLPLMWPLHRYHHAAEDFGILTAARGHPGAALTQVAIKTLPLAILGVSANSIIDMSMFAVVMNYFIHSRISLRLGWFGRWVFQTPLNHRMHHVRDFSGESWNYSLCPLWDRLFGTWRENADQVEIGVDYGYRHGAWVLPDIMRDYREFLAGWLRLLRPAQRAHAANTISGAAADNATETAPIIGHQTGMPAYEANQAALETSQAG